MSVDEKQIQELKENRQNAMYWLWDDPEIMQTKRNEIYYYPNAGRLVVRLPQYKGMLGKLAALNLFELAKAPEVLERLISILQGLKAAEAPEA